MWPFHFLNERLPLNFDLAIFKRDLRILIGSYLMYGSYTLGNYHKIFSDWKNINVCYSV
jgi:hypothetical protein